MSGFIHNQKALLRPGGHGGALMACALTAAALISFLIRFLAYGATEHPYGFDGYYYASQVSWLLRYGHIHSPEASWTLWLFNGLGLVTDDPILAVKLGSALLVAAMAPAAWLLGVATGGVRSGAILCGWALMSPTLTHLGGDFPKVAGMLPCLLAALAFLHMRPVTPFKVIAGVCFGLLAITAHRSGLVLLLLSIAGIYVAGRMQKASAKSMKVVVIAAGVALLLLVIASATLPNLLHYSDIARLQGKFAFSLTSFPPWCYFDQRSTGLPQQMELIAAWPVFAAGLLLWWRRPRLRMALTSLLLPLLALILPVWRRDHLDMGYRLWLMAPAFAAPVLALMPLKVPPVSLRWRVAAAVCVVALAVAVAPTGLDTAASPPYERYRAMIERIPRPLPERVITHQGINFYYAHLTGRYGVPWAPPAELDRTTVFRLAWGIRPEEWYALCPEIPGAPRPLAVDVDYTYIREDVWEGFVAAALKDDDDDLINRIHCRRNPMRHKPRYLERNWE